MHRRLIILLTTILILTIAGCRSDEEQQLREWQQTQVAELQQQAEQNSAAARALVEADAQARQELVKLERDLQAELATIGQQRDALEGERKGLADERQQAPLMAAVVQGFGSVLLCALPLVLCFLLLRGSSGDTTTGDLEDLLIRQLADDHAPLNSNTLLIGRTDETLAALEAHTSDSSSTTSTDEPGEPGLSS